MNKPNLTKEQALLLLQPFNLAAKVIVLGIRGNLAQNKNQRGIYDDALFIVTPEIFKGYNANTDPSVTRPGVAVLQPGVYDYIKGLHGIHHLDLSKSADVQIMKTLMETKKDIPLIAGRIIPYWALRQASDVTIKRDGNSQAETDSPSNRFWIDIHRGGYSTTSSLGCQTIYPDLWNDFRDTIFSEMEKNNEPLIHYVLIDQK